MARVRYVRRLHRVPPAAEGRGHRRRVPNRSVERSAPVLDADHRLPGAEGDRHRAGRHAAVADEPLDARGLQRNGAHGLLDPRSRRRADCALEDRGPAVFVPAGERHRDARAAGLLESYRERGGVGMFLGLSQNGTVVPISLTRNRRTGAIACDHTLPPVFYLSTWAATRASARTPGSPRSSSPTSSSPSRPSWQAGRERRRGYAGPDRGHSRPGRGVGAAARRPVREAAPARLHALLHRDQGFHSRIHLQNFYSTFWPQVHEPATAHITAFDAGGRCRGTRHARSRDSAPCSSGLSGSCPSSDRPRPRARWRSTSSRPPRSPRSCTARRRPGRDQDAVLDGATTRPNSCTSTRSTRSAARCSAPPPCSGGR